MKKQSGFTLVELMIVVAIIGILAAIAIPKFADMLEKSREGATKGNLSSVKSAVSIFYGDQEGNNPSNLDNTTPTQVNGITYFFIPAYMDSIPPVKVTAKHTTNTTFSSQGPGVGNSNAFVFTGSWNSPAFASGGKGWKYESPLLGSGASGSVWVNSYLRDMSTRSYTIYGFE